MYVQSTFQSLILEVTDSDVRTTDMMILVEANLASRQLIEQYTKMSHTVLYDTEAAERFLDAVNLGDLVTGRDSHTS